MPGSTVSYRRLSNELLDIRRETRWVEGGNRNTPFPLPPFAKGGSGGISEGVENPPRSPFTKGGRVFSDFNKFPPLTKGG